MANMIPISTVTVSAGGASAIEFTGIPQNYTDLKLVYSARSSYASVWDHIYYRLNGDTANNYVSRWLQGSGSATLSSNQTATSSLQPRYAIPGANATASTFGNGELYIPSYTSSNNKSQSLDTVTENNATEAYSVLTAGIWNNTSPINSISIYPYFGTTFVQYSSATLYGIRKY